MDPQLEPLVSAASQWAAGRGRMLDVELLVQALDLRLAHDQMGDNYWPRGSARHLMTVRYPNHGPVEAPDADRLLATLGTYWRFLRVDGRMSAASAQPAELLAEGRASRRRMAQLCADEALVRRRQTLAERAERLAAGVDPADVAAAAAGFRSSGLWALLQELVAWVGEGRRVDEDGQLLVADARAAWDAFGLGAWQAGFEAMLAGTPAGDEPLEPLPWNEEWVSATQCVAVDRLWWVAVATGLVAVQGPTALAAPVEPQYDEQWLDLALAVLCALARWASYGGALEPLPSILLLVNGPDGRPRMLAEMLEFHLMAVAAARADGSPRVAEDEVVEQGSAFAGCLAVFDDAGVWRREGEGVEGTELGWSFALELDEALRSGEIVLVPAPDEA